MVSNILIVDTETTGLSPADSRIVEVAVVLYSIPAACVVSSFAALLRGDTNEAESINRIPVAALTRAPVGLFAWNRVSELVDYACDGGAVWMAHRASFDRSFLEAYVPRVAERLPWVCSKFDVEWPESKPGASCVEMALAHGVPVVSAHRALTDCMLIAGTLAAVQRSGRDLEGMIEKAMRPRVLLRALVSYDDREKAKSAGFAFNGADKTWTRRVVADEAHAYASTLPFRTEVVQP